MNTNQQKLTFDFDLEVSLDSTLALEGLQKEVSSMAKHSIDEGREYLSDLEIEHLIKMIDDVIMRITQQTNLVKMTNDVVMKITQQTKESYQ